MSLTADQFNQLLAALPAMLGAGGGGANQSQGAASAVGPMGHCNLGVDKVKRFKRFSDWMKGAEAKIDFMGLTTDKQKISLLRSWAGPELLVYWEREVGIRFQAVERVQAVGDVAEIPGQPAHTFKELVDLTRKEILKHVNRDRSIIDLLHMRQAGESWMAFIHDLEEAADLCQLGVTPFTRDDAIRVAALAGMKDRNLAEKALAEKYSLQILISTGSTRETSKATADALQGKSATTHSINKMQDKKEDEGSSMSEEELDRTIARLTVRKMQKSGKYSVRTKRKEHRPQREVQMDKAERCRNCKTRHEPHRCPAKGKDCFDCEGEDHFANTPACPRKKTPYTTKKLTVEEEESEGSRYSDSEADTRDSQRVGRITVWDSTVRRVETGEENDRWVVLKMGDRKISLFSDTGSKFTIIPPEFYHPHMGKLVRPNTSLRAWGSRDKLDVRGMFKTCLATSKGARKWTTVYVVAGYRPEALLGDADASDLGIISFNCQGRDPTQEELAAQERPPEVRRVSTTPSPEAEIRTGCIAEKIRRKLGVEVKTNRPPPDTVPAEEMARVNQVVEEFIGTVFSDKIGCIKANPVVLDFDPKHKPTQPPYRPIPLHYRDRVSAHLNKLREEGIITDVDPRKSYDCVMNTVITDKSAPGEIRMNIDSTPQNPGMRRTKYHVKTPQEVRHDLDGAVIFSEMDMGMGFHQLALDRKSKDRSIFQTHQGLHRMERLYFGPTSSTGIFHNEVAKALRGVPGCTTIHDNILVGGKDYEDHRRNLRATLERCLEKGITLKLKKSTFCQKEVAWFGRTFSATGVSADPHKIKAIIEAGRPESTDEVRSLIQAAAYNARFMFDHSETSSYEETTAPLREMLAKGAIFAWDKRREKAYQTLMRMMSSEATLRPFTQGLPTMFVSDASPWGIAASLYQVREDKTWVPVDHISRALTKEERAWGSQIDWESLGKSWGMDQFRFYLSGQHFTSWGDQKPLLPLYNDMTRPASVRVNKHRQKIQDLSFTDKYMSGKVIPCDFNSRHPNSIDHMTTEERQRLGIDNGDEITIRRIFLRDLPDAVTPDMIREVAEGDSVYRDLREAVKSGRKPADGRLVAYTSIWPELAVVDNIVCRGERIVVPDGEVFQEGGNIRTWLTEISHDGHHGMDHMKRYLRPRLWWPGMDRQVERRSAGCEACQASTPQHRRDPLQPTTAPTKPWERVAADHWGPTPTCSVLVMVDHLTKYPEVEVVKGTSAHDNIVAIDNIFTRQGFLDILFTDNGAPFNGGPRHELQEYFKWAGVKHKLNRSAEDPEANGLAESFMKHIKKIWHTATLEEKDPVMEINKHLRVQRATPHPSTGAAPAELLNNRKYKTRLPDIRADPAEDREDIREARDRDRKAKLRQKRYKDSKTTVKHHNIQVGDRVLLNRRQTKLHSPYDPSSYVVSEVHGTQVVARRGVEQKTRDAQYWKKIDTSPRIDYAEIRLKQARRERQDDYYPDIGAPAGLGDQAVPAAEQAGPQADLARPTAAVGPRGREGRAPVREVWSFRTPRDWPANITRAVTRSVSARRQANRERARERAGGQ